MTLAELTAEEERLLELVSHVTGLMEDKATQLESAGVFSAYAEVHSAYVRLAEESPCVEALKRAVFLQWYALSEPSCFTGLSDLNEGAERRALESVNALTEKGELDDEFKWMLTYYFKIADYFLIPYEGLKALKKFCGQKHSELWSRGTPSQASLSGRGQMSRYWLGITIPKSAK